MFSVLIISLARRSSYKRTFNTCFHSQRDQSDPVTLIVGQHMSQFLSCVGEYVQPASMLHVVGSLGRTFVCNIVSLYQIAPVIDFKNKNKMDTFLNGFGLTTKTTKLRLTAYWPFVIDGHVFACWYLILRFRMPDSITHDGSVWLSFFFFFFFKKRFFLIRAPKLSISFWPYSTSAL